MELETSPEQAQLQQIARSFGDDALRPAAAARDASSEFPTDDLRRMARFGLMGVNVGKAYGGTNAGVVAYSLAVTEIARADPAVAVTMCVNNMVCEVIEAFGTDAQRARWIPPITSGESLAGSFCLSEPGSGSDAAGMATRAVKTDEGWRINGAKAWITSGAHAGVFLVWAQTHVEGGADGEGSDVISLFLVDPSADGISVGKAEEKMGQHASNTVQLSFDDVLVPDDALLGEIGHGFKVAMMALDGGRIGIGSQALGIAVEALALAQRRLRPHDALGYGRLADYAAQLEAARLLVLRAAWLKEQGARRYSREASMAKLHASEVACRICEWAAQLPAPDTPETPTLEKLLRDARVTRIYEGTSEIQRIVIARDLLRNGA